MAYYKELAVSCSLEHCSTLDSRTGQLAAGVVVAGSCCTIPGCCCIPGCYKTLITEALVAGFRMTIVGNYLHTGFGFMVRAAGCSLGSCRCRTIVGAYFGSHCSSFTEEVERSDRKSVV